MSQPQKIDQLLTEVLEVKAALANITEVINEHRKCLEDFGRALQDCVDVLQPQGHDLRQGTTPKQPTATVQPVAQPATPAVVQPAPAVQPAASAPVPAATKSGPSKIGGLKDGDKKVNVTGKIIIINAERKTKTGKRVAECVIGDESGTIRLSLWESQIDLVKEGSVVSIENGFVTSFQEKTVLNAGQYGTLKVEAPP